MTERVILLCRPLGVVELVQEGAKGPIENPRVILMPIWHDCMGELGKATDLPARVKAEIEQFFLNTTLFTDKQAKVTGWARAEGGTQIGQRKPRRHEHVTSCSDQP